MAENNRRKIAILGSTGSIGTQALDVIANNPDAFEVYLLTANRNADLLIEQAIKFQPDSVVICDESRYTYVKEALSQHLIKVFAGHEAVEQAVQNDYIDIVLTAMVGFAGLKSTISAIKAGKVIALANKETLVVAGEYINRLAIEYKAPIIPVDSGHSAIFQCLVGEGGNPIDKIILTASGGPFRGMSLEQLEKMRPEDALKHPNWNMGSKITIDSASMMNKGLEMIEACWLFGVSPEQIDIVVHPQSIIHSLVQFLDGSVKAQLSLPDMRLPIQYAFSYPDRIKNTYPKFSFAEYSNLTFEQPDMKTFGSLSIAYRAMREGGNRACVMNAANEIAVEAFLKNKIRFTDIPEVVEETLSAVEFIKKPSLDDFYSSDLEARKESNQTIEKIIYG
jgi:1-deoxy-D-xylulose-5-phosphate reductoisomerase